MNRKFFCSWTIVGFGLNCLWLSSVLWFRGGLILALDVLEDPAAPGTVLKVAECQAHSVSLSALFSDLECSSLLFQATRPDATL